MVTKDSRIVSLLDDVRVVFRYLAALRPSRPPFCPRTTFEKQRALGRVRHQPFF